MIPPGKIDCPTCLGNGYVYPPPVGHAWLICPECGGIGTVWAPGGPLFDCVHTLGDQVAGAIVTLPTGHRGRVQWHMPRPTKKIPAEITFVTLIDDFDDYESPHPTAFHSCIGVVSVAPYTRGGELHDGEKAADAVDPIARRVLEHSGDLV